MLYSSELNFLRKSFKKCNLQTLLINPRAPLDKRLDLGLRIYFDDENEYKKSLSDYINPINTNTIYKFKDEFSCCYLFMPLPDNENETLLSIGPYLSAELTREKILSWAESNKLNAKQAKQLEIYYSGIPTINDNSSIFAMIDTFAESVFGGNNNYSVVDINQEFATIEPHINIKSDQHDNEKSMLNMQIMEARYAYENEMILAVSQGQSHKAEMMLAGVSKLSFETRLSDPVRNVKNYCIIMNTLLRKAAENGGVHPVYLDSTSSDFAKKIETLSSIYAVHELMIEMFKTYCGLVNKHSLKNYSAPVQKVIVCIDSDLTADLSLSSLAEMLNISAGYLSALFKKETGQTLTEYVNNKRIKHAKTLLKTTNLQIQTVAQYCGILDIQYFSKMFKKHTGKTPKEYRDSK